MVAIVSLCDTCRDPGHCCQAFPIGRLFPIKMSRAEVKEHIQNGTHEGNTHTPKYEKYPFEPVRQSFWHAWPGQHKPSYTTWLFSCPELDENGRCSIYENRPGPCRLYKPGCDTMCVHYTGSWKGKLMLFKEEEK